MDYRGDIGVILLNTGTESVVFTKDTAIAQGVINEIIQGEFTIVAEEELEKTERGTGGFGSTGSLASTVK